MSYEEMMVIHHEMQAMFPKEPIQKGWKHKASTFTYCGDKVTRNTYSFITPLGIFRVYEAVSGRCFYEYPSKSISAENENHISFSTAKMPCDSIDNGKQLCKEKWDKMKLDAFNQEM